MATIPHTLAKIGGVVMTPVSATAGPDTMKPGDNVNLIVNNGNASATVVTIVVPGNTKYGQAIPDVTGVSIPAGSHAVFGPFPADLADPADNLIDITAVPFASVTFYAVRAN